MVAPLKTRLGHFLYSMWGCTDVTTCYLSLSLECPTPYFGKNKIFQAWRFQQSPSLSRPRHFAHRSHRRCGVAAKQFKDLMIRVAALVYVFSYVTYLVGSLFIRDDTVGMLRLRIFLQSSLEHVCQRNPAERGSMLLAFFSMIVLAHDQVTVHVQRLPCVTYIYLCVGIVGVTWYVIVLDYSLRAGSPSPSKLQPTN